MASGSSKTTTTNNKLTVPSNSSTTPTNSTSFSLNSEENVCLQDILDSFNSSVNEEHVWALCYQCAKCFIECLRNNRGKCRNVTHVSHVFLHSDGNVHPCTIQSERVDQKPLKCEQELVLGLGIIAYSALDVGYQSGEERVISRELEELIDLMTSEEDDEDLEEDRHHGRHLQGGEAEPYRAETETDDEGIERDCCPTNNAHAHREAHAPRGDVGNNVRGKGAAKGFLLQDVLRRCAQHVGVRTIHQAETHYRAVVRALVAEVLELSSFLEKVSHGTQGMRLLDPSAAREYYDGGLGSLDGANNSCLALDQLSFSDWAKFWVQVINELRMGVKLKKVDSTRAPTEFELTPYEILMNDIKTRSYKLRHIMVDGDIPLRVKKDAHELILEFIRSRPPLRKVSERTLSPLHRVPTPHEKLLASIKRGRKLRPVPKQRKLIPSSVDSSAPTNNVQNMEPNPSQRRLIKVDFAMLQGESEEDDDDEEVTSPLSPGLEASTSPVGISGPNKASLHLRRHSISACTSLTTSELVTLQPAPCSSSRPSSRWSDPDSAMLEATLPELSWSQDDVSQPKEWHEAMSLDDRLSLTLQEIVHIRSVLTKAELEALPVESNVKDDVEKRRVCFLCLKTRFGLLGPWGQRCKLCNRTVCTKCYAKMRIPTEHFSNVPVVLLSPSVLCTPEDDHKEFFTRSLMSKLAPDSAANSSPLANGGCSAPSSPGLLKAGDDSGSKTRSSSPGGVSTSPTTSRRSRLFRALTTARQTDTKALEKKGVQMIICLDCKIMVLQIIKSTRTNRAAIRDNLVRNLTLNLSPVY